jgi:hypothetical protein
VSYKKEEPWKKELEKLIKDAEEARKESLKEEEKVRRSLTKKPINIPPFKPPEEYYTLVSKFIGPVKLEIEPESQVERDLRGLIEKTLNSGVKDARAVLDSIYSTVPHYMLRTRLDFQFELQKNISDILRKRREEYERR